MRLLFVVLVGLLVLIQYPLWLGQGSWSRVWRLDQSLALQREVNAGKRLRNEGLEAEAGGEGEDVRVGVGDGRGLRAALRQLAACFAHLQA